jgi:hypothetical protein
MTVLGYKYLTEEDAQQARKDCSDYYGIPVSPEDTTQYWVDYYSAMLDEPVFWFILFNESLLPILGEPTEFDVVQPTPFEDATN